MKEYSFSFHIDNYATVIVGIPCRNLAYDRPLLGIDKLHAILSVIKFRVAKRFSIGRPRNILHTIAESPLHRHAALRSTFHHDIRHIVLLVDVSNPRTVGRYGDKRINPPFEQRSFSYIRGNDIVRFFCYFLEFYTALLWYGYRSIIYFFQTRTGQSECAQQQTSASS